MAALTMKTSTSLLYNNYLLLLRHSRTLYSSGVTLGKAVKAPGVSLLEKEWQREFYQKEKGKIYDKKPFKLTLQPGKPYLWCACGHSKSQPLCDGTHLMAQLRIRVKPIMFRVSEETDVWLCNCKQTNNKPFCDGTHRQEDIQTAIK
ncbi:hypothetical protein Pmani_025672 [Petrolisthes manimaculis]|uniref:Iron-binding zinc finger CDGSH type domain-containing protein n=1 Tax=Petrolisthes manimaculis TaxID=1843537 RepID=A0AAE1TY64_9EUCA|nr:hypothetical protein Pmani_025672 [Petrolisthes manimaculis]